MSNPDGGGASGLGISRGRGHRQVFQILFTNTAILMVLFICFYILVVLGFELRASQFLGK
jgi:hypothetical protein